jgi:hypothetical protein
MPELKRLTLENAAAGAAPELFARALEEVLANIKDPDTPAEAKRTITLKFEFVPHEDRQGGRNEASVSVACTSKLAAPNPASGFLFVSREKGEVVAYTNDVQQEEIDLRSGEVLPMKNGPARA